MQAPAAATQVRPKSPGPIIRFLSRTTRPLTTRLAGTRLLPFWALLRHRGRRSGKWYTTPIVARPTPDGFVVPLPWGAGTDWCRNVRAAGECFVRWRGIEHPMVDPAIVDPRAAAAAFHPIERALLRALAINQFLRLVHEVA